MLISNTRESVVSVSSQAWDEVVDTTFLYEELRRDFHSKGEAVEVNFRKLVGWMRLGDQLTHQLHPYPAKLLPHIAHFFLRTKFAGPNRTVLDPFCGSGTVALEASMAGYRPLVVDANPLALLLTKVKTTPYNIDELVEQTGRLIGRISRLRKAPEIPVVNAAKWYSADTKGKLEIILRAINEVDDLEIQDFFKVGFSLLTKRLSRADPVISVPVELREKAKFSDVVNKRIRERLDWIDRINPVDEFARICYANIDRIATTNRIRPNRLPALIAGVDARKMSGGVHQQVDGVPLVVTSPPYGTAQKYVRASSLSLNWLGLAHPDGLTTLESQSIGREHSPRYRNENSIAELPSEFEALLEKVNCVNETRARLTRQYLSEMKGALEETASVTTSGGRIVLIIGNNEVCGHSLRNDLFLTQVLEGCGCKLELSLVDHIKSRGLLTKRHATASVISRESILVFSKG